MIFGFELAAILLVLYNFQFVQFAKDNVVYSYVHCI